MKRLVRVAEWPFDFRQLLCDIWDDELHIHTDLPEFLLVEKRDIRIHREEVLECIHDSWTHCDFKKGCEFTNHVVNPNVEIPPLIVSHSFLRDGYHRVFAMFLCGIDEWEVIDLDHYR